MRVAALGKAFALAGSPFRFRGARYERSSEAGSNRERFRLDLAALNVAGFTVVSLRPFPESEIEQATATGLRFMLEIDDVELNALAGASRRERRRVAGDLARRVRRYVRSWRGSHLLLGVAFSGHDLLDSSRPQAHIARRMGNELAKAVHDEDASLLAAWRDVWPLDGECPAEFDFLLCDFELASWDQLAPAIMACHGEVGDRPLVLNKASARDAARGFEPDMGWLIDTALRCGVGGTIAAAPQNTTGRESEIDEINARTVRSLDIDWPSISVVINAYNAASTIDECLNHCDRLDYPELEVIVVDDGSTDATAEIVGTHHSARLITIPRSGLSVGRNAGYHSARGELVAYLDADAYPSPEWPWYLALAARGDGRGGSGGPNVPPAHQPKSARVVARSPGGPVPQLLGADRAKHVPGCNMAFWKHVLEQLQGFDPVLEGAEDIEFEWRLLDSGHDIGYHPAALVWHYRRPGLGPYLRQQRHYGRAQAILERRYPDRFRTGHRVIEAARRLRPGREETDGTAVFAVRYLTLARPESALLDLAHQWGVPAALMLAFTAPLALVRRKLGAPAVAATTFVAVLLVTDAVLAGADLRRCERRLGFRTTFAVFRLLRPLAFRWGHLRAWHKLCASAPEWPPPPEEPPPNGRAVQP